MWSKILTDLKSDRNDEVLLVPIAADQNITSLNLLMAEYNVDRLPAVVINNDQVLYELEELSTIEDFLLT